MKGEQTNNPNYFISDEQKIQHGYLLADFQAVKAEIARRSNAQKTALAALVMFYAWLLNELVSTKLGLWHIVAVWTVTSLSYIFYKREGLEIGRLGSLIRTKIAQVASQNLNIPKENIIPSEAFAADQKFDYKTRRLNRIFFAIIFCLLPITLTIIFLAKDIFNLIFKLAF